MNSSPRWKNDTDMYIWMMFEGCNLSERHSGCSFVPIAWNMNSFSIQRSRDIGQNAVAIFLLLEIYRRYCLRSGDRRGNTGASLQKYCASVEKIIRFFNYGMPYVDGNFHSGTMVSSSISSFFFFSLLLLQGNFYCGSTCVPETYSRIDENRVEITYSWEPVTSVFTARQLDPDNISRDRMFLTVKF